MDQVFKSIHAAVLLIYVHSGHRLCRVFYRAGEFEGSSGIVWAGLSALISIAIWYWLHGGLLIILLGQFALFAGITLYRSRKKE